MQSHGASMLLGPLRRGIDEIAARDFSIQGKWMAPRSSDLSFPLSLLARVEELIK